MLLSDIIQQLGGTLIENGDVNVKLIVCNDENKQIAVIHGD